MSLKTGTQVGHYVIQELVGSGAMGAVYRALDPRLERQVAVKVLLSGEAPDPERVERFAQEARAAATLAHPNILTIFDVGTHDARPYLVCEMLEGETLRQRLDRGPLAPPAALEIVSQLLKGIAAAHGAQVIHRDIKPENVFLTADGIVKILDFGLAKLRPRVIEGTDQETLAATMAGSILGTLAYMAPEQLQAPDAVDARADLFAIGAVLYEMLAGTSPFARGNAPATIAAVLRESPSPMREACPPALEKVVLRALEKDPAYRFQSATDLAFAIDNLPELEHAAPAAAPEAPTPSSIAVLPFTHLSHERDDDYFCDGLAEELINALTHIKGLRVASRSSSFLFRDPGVDVQEVGRRLGVATVLEGSVRKAGDRLRITAQLIDVADGFHRWSERYDRKLEDVFAMQEEIAEGVASSLRGLLSPQEREALQRPATDVEAYEYYLRGRQLLNRWNDTDAQAAVRMFERAIEVDADYAPAYAGLAEAHAMGVEWFAAGDRSRDLAAEASRRAVELAPNFAEAHAARGYALAAKQRYEAAVREYQEATRLNPQLFEAYYYYARTCFAQGQIKRSVELFRKASEVRPEDFQSLVLLAQSLRMLGREREADAANDEGLRRVERTLELNPSDARALALGALAVFHAGDPERALRWSRRARELHPDDYSVLTNSACLAARAGRTEEAIEILERVFARGYGKREWIENDPDYDSVRDDPRFLAMFEKLP